MKGDNVPTEQDWGSISTEDLDLQAAYKDFFGKTNDELATSFGRCPIEMADGLRWMPALPFRYYVKGFAEFVMSGAFHRMDAPDVASTFLGLVEHKLRQQPAAIDPVMKDLLPIVEHVSRHQADYYADPEIYGDFMEKARLINELWASCAGKF